MCTGGEIFIESSSDVVAVPGGVELAGPTAVLSVPSGFTFHTAPATDFSEVVRFSDEGAVYKTRGVPQNASASFAVSKVVSASLSSGSVQVTRLSASATDFSLKLLSRGSTDNGFTGLPLKWQVDASSTGSSDENALSFSWDSVVEPSTLPNKTLVGSLNGTTWLGIRGVVVAAAGRVVTVASHVGSLSAKQFVVGSAVSPEAAQDTLDRQPNQRIKLHTSLLLANDFDGGGTLSVSAVSGTSARGGTVSLAGNWVFYTPANGLDDAYLSSPQSVVPVVDSFTYTLSNTFGTSTGTAYLTIPADPTAQSQTLTSAPANPSGPGKIAHFAGVPGRNYQVFAKDSLTDPWPTNPNAMVQADAKGRLLFTDTGATGVSRFYRLQMVRQVAP